MSDVVISIENLSKRYLIGHQSVQREHYQALRDIVGREARNFVRKTADLVRGRQIVQGDEIEDFWALKDISFEVKRSEVLGIIGRNGAGKSTLLKVLSRVTEPSEGRVRLRGRVGSLLEVGSGFHPELTGRENIYLNGTILGMTRAEIRRNFDEIVAFAEVEKFLDTPVKRYSSGMYVRLAFAIAAHLEPEILIVDEVLAVGDAEFQKKCLGRMSEVARRGRTVLFVSHNQIALRTLCTHGIVLRNGMASSKQDISSALHAYSQDGVKTMASSWKRASNASRAAARLLSIESVLRGKQPSLRLECVCEIDIGSPTRPLMIAVDVTDANQYPIMQAVPSPKGFIGGDPGTYEVRMIIDLPPMVPGLYCLDFWIGPHNSETSDLVRGAATLEVSESPSSGRTVPHTPDHGFIVPHSSAEVRIMGSGALKVMSF